MLSQTNYKYPSCKKVAVKICLAHQLDYTTYMQWLNCYIDRSRAAVIMDCHKDLKLNLRCISHKNNVTVTL